HFVRMQRIRAVGSSAVAARTARKSAVFGRSQEMVQGNAIARSRSPSRAAKHGVEHFTRQPANDARGPRAEAANTSSTSGVRGVKSAVVLLVIDVFTRRARPAGERRCSDVS